MRPLAVVLVAAAILFGLYHFYGKSPVSDTGTAPTQAISLTGVRMDLVQIAEAERSTIALNGRCASLDELMSSASLTFTRRERDGYSYTVECAGSDFTVTARHAAAAAGSPIRYPTLSIDQTQQTREVD
jgi:hypothetical protein